MSVEILGGEGGNKKWLLLGGVAIGAYLLFRPRPMAMISAPGSYSVSMADTEFAKITADSSDQLAQLQTSAALEKRMIDNGYAIQAGQTPGNLRTCVPYSKYFALGGAGVKELDQQVKDGQLIKQPTAQGICYTPTRSGIEGHPPNVTQKTNRSLFGASTSTSGPAGSFAPPTVDPGQPTIGTIFDDIASFFTGRKSQSSYGGHTPPINPVPDNSSYQPDFRTASVRRNTIQYNAPSLSPHPQAQEVFSHLLTNYGAAGIYPAALV